MNHYEFYCTIKDIVKAKGDPWLHVSAKHDLVIHRNGRIVDERGHGFVGVSISYRGSETEIAFLSTIKLWQLQETVNDAVAFLYRSYDHEAKVESPHEP